MEFALKSSALIERLGALSRVISANPAVPILDSFLFDIRDKKISITASDLHTTTVVTNLSIDSDLKTRVAIPGRIFLETLKSLPEQELLFKLNPQNYSLNIHSSTGIYTLACPNPTDYPEVAGGSEISEEIDISSQLLKEAIERVLFCVSKSGTHPALEGVRMEVKGDRIRLVATEGHRLALFAQKGISAQAEHAFTLTGKSLEHLTKLLSGDKGNCKLVIRKDSVSFVFSEFTLSSNLIAEEYPNYEHVIPRQHPYKLKLKTDDLLKALKIMQVYANKSTQQIRFKPTKDRLYLSAEDLNFSNEAKEQLPCTYDGKVLEICFNVRLLSELLQKVDADQVILSLDSAHRGVLVLPEEQQKNTRLLLLIMPILLQQK